LAGSGPAPHANAKTQAGKLLPVDDSAQDPAFLTYKKELAKVIVVRDWPRLTRDFATPEFAGFFQALEVPRELLWKSLDRILRFGMVRTSPTSFEGPYFDLLADGGTSRLIVIESDVRPPV
jgi:hypothetical protein